MDLPRPQRIPHTRAYMSQAARALVERLRHLQPSEGVSYDELSTLAGVNVQERRDLLTTARDYLCALEGMVFDCDTGHGLVRLTDSAKIGRGVRKRGMVHRAARKNVQELQTVDYAQLTDVQKYQHLAELSISGAVVVATHDTTARQIETQRTPQPVLIDPTQYPDPFKGL